MRLQSKISKSLFLITMVAIFGGHKAKAENINLRIRGFADQSIKVKVSESQRLAWVSWPEAVNTEIVSSMSDGKERVYSKGKCEISYELAKSDDDINIRNGAIKNSYNVDYNWPLLPITPSNQDFKKELLRQAQKSGYKSSKITIANPIKIKDMEIDFEWKRNSFSEIIGFDEIEEKLTNDILSQIKEIESGGVVHFSSKRDDFNCDLLNGMLKVSAVIHAETDNEVIRIPQITTEDVMRLSKGLVSSSNTSHNQSLSKNERLVLAGAYLSRETDSLLRKGPAEMGEKMFVKLFDGLFDIFNVSPVGLNFQGAEQVARSVDKIKVVTENFKVKTNLKKVVWRKK